MSLQRMRWIKWLKSVLLVPAYFDFFTGLFEKMDGPISRRWRKRLFLICGGFSSGVLYRWSEGIPRWQAIVGGFFGGLIYRFKVGGLENLPEGGCLILSNHVTNIDAVVLQFVCPRSIRFIVHENVCQLPWLHSLLRLGGAAETIVITDRRAKSAISQAAKCIQEGEIVCIFPEGEISKSGELMNLKGGFELITRLSGAVAVPVWLEGLSGSIFAFSQGQYLLRMPKIPTQVTIRFGKPIPASEVNVNQARARLLELSEAFIPESRADAIAP